MFLNRFHPGRVLVSGVIPPAPAVAASIMISARLKRVYRRISPVNVQIGPDVHGMIPWMQALMRERGHPGGAAGPDDGQAKPRAGRWGTRKRRACVNSIVQKSYP